MQWTRELYHYEVSPPPGSWDRISFELENDITDLRMNLKNLEEPPPPAVWESVRKELASNEPARVIPLPWYSRWSGWAAAAAVSGVLFLAYYLMNGRNDFKPAELATSIQSPESTSIVSKSKIPTQITVVPPVAKEPPANEEKKSQRTNDAAQTNIETATVALHTAEKKPTKHYHVPAVLEPGTRKEDLPMPQTLHDNRDYRKMKSVQFDDGNYIQLVSSEGNTTRLSYKLQEMIPAIRNDVDNATLAQWKSKLATTAFMPASVNFFDITDMVTILAENK